MTTGFTPQEQQLLNAAPLTPFEQGLDLRQVAYMREQAYLYQQGQISEQVAAQESLDALSRDQQAALVTDGRLDVMAAVRQGVPDLVLRGVGLPQEAIERGRLAVTEQQASLPILQPIPTVADLQNRQPIQIAAEAPTSLVAPPLPPEVVPDTTPPVLSLPLPIVVARTGPVAPITIPADHVNALQDQLANAQYAILRGAPELVYERIREFWSEFNQDVDGLRQKYEGSADFYPRAIASAENNIYQARRNPNLTPEQVESNVATYQARIDKLRIEEKQNRQAMADFDRYVTAIRAQINETIRDTLAGIPPVVPAVDNNRANVLVKLAPYQSEGGYDLARAISEKAVTVTEAATIFDPLEVLRVTIPQVEAAPITTTPITETVGEFDIEAERDAAAYWQFGPEAVARQEARNEIDQLTLNGQPVSFADGSVNIPAVIALGRRDLLTQLGFEDTVIDDAVAQQQQLQRSALQLAAFQESRQPIIQLTEQRERIAEIDQVVADIDAQSASIEAQVQPLIEDIARPGPGGPPGWSVALDQLAQQRAQLIEDRARLEQFQEPIRPGAAYPGLAAPGFRATLPVDIRERQEEAASATEAVASIGRFQSGFVFTASADYQALARRQDVINVYAELGEQGLLTPEQVRTEIERIPEKPTREDWEAARLGASNFLITRTGFLPGVGGLAGATIGTALAFDLRSSGGKALDVGLLLAQAVPTVGTLRAASREIGATQGVLPRISATTQRATEMEVRGIADLVRRPIRSTADMVKQGLLNPLEATYSAIRAPIPIGTTEGQRLLGFERHTHTLRVGAKERFPDDIGALVLPEGLWDDVAQGLVAPTAIKQAVSESTLAVMQTGKTKAVPVLKTDGTASDFAIKVEGSELHRAAGRGFAFSGTPDGRFAMLDEGFTVDEGLLYLSPDPHSRFTTATSTGKAIQVSPEQAVAFRAAGLSDKPIPTVFIFSGDDLLSRLQGSAVLPGVKGEVPANIPGAVPKLYKGVAEIEAVAPAGLKTGKAVQKPFFLRDNAGNRVQVLVFGKPISRFEIAKLNIRAPLAAARTIAAPAGEIVYVGPKTTAKGRARLAQTRRANRNVVTDDLGALELRVQRFTTEARALRAAGDFRGAYGAALEAALTRQAINQLFGAPSEELIAGIRGIDNATQSSIIRAPRGRRGIDGDIARSPDLRGSGDFSGRSSLGRTELVLPTSGRRAAAVSEIRRAGIGNGERRPGEFPTSPPIRTTISTPRKTVGTPSRLLVPGPGRTDIPGPGRIDIPGPGRTDIPGPGRTDIPDGKQRALGSGPSTQPSKLPLLGGDHPKRVGWNTGVFDTTVDLPTGEVTWHKDLPEIPEIPAEQSFRVLERGLRPSPVREFPMGKAHVTISGQGVKFRGRRAKLQGKRASKVYALKGRRKIAYESPGG